MAAVEAPSRTQLLTPEQAADRLGCSVETLKTWRRTGRGPAFTKMSPRMVRYQEAALEAFIAAGVRQSAA